MDKTADIVILIEDHILRKNIIDKFKKRSKYKVIADFENGVKCLDYLLEHECDLLIIDLMLSNIDGIGIINQIKETNKHAFNHIVCISDFTDHLLFDMVDELSIDYCIRKPFSLDYFIQIINRIVKIENNDDFDTSTINNEICDIFNRIGIPRHLKGYNYLVTGISNISKDISLLNGITKELYPSIARNYSTTASRVEQAIRHVLKVTWGNGNQDEINKIFGYRAKNRPCNSEFMTTIANIILSNH